MLLKVRALIKLKVNMVEKCTSEMFVLGVVETSSYIGGGGYCLCTLVPFPDLPYSIWAYSLRQIQMCVY